MMSPIAWASVVFQVGDLTYASLDETSVEVVRLREAYTLEEVQVPETVEAGGYTYDVVRIGNGAFKDCKTLKHLLLPMGIKEFGEYCFANCDALLNLSMPSSLLTIERSAFEGCSTLPLIALPNSVTTIAEDAFAFCTSARQASIPKSVVEIGDGVFKGCSGLEFIYGQHTSDDNKCLIMNNRLIAIAPLGKTSFAIPSGVTAIGASTFLGCSNLQSVTIPATMAAIDEMAFMGCTAINTADLPESMHAIGICAFKGCTKLQTVILPKNLMLIGDYAFDDCTSMGAVKSYITDPNTVALGQCVFGATPPEGCTLYVPAGTEDLYKNAENEQWRQFFSIVGFGDSGIDSVISATEGDTQVYYDLVGRRVVNPTTGIYILNGRKVFVK